MNWLMLITVLLLMSLTLSSDHNKVGCTVFLADMRYFPVGHRGVYHTVGNNFFLNVAYASPWYYDVSDAS